MDSTPSPEPPAFWLSSRELTAWAPARACRVTGPASSPSPAPALAVTLDPPGPGGDRVVLAPRYAGDELRPEPGRPVVVNVFSPGGELVAVADLHAAPEEAERALAETMRQMQGAR